MRENDPPTLGNYYQARLMPSCIKGAWLSQRLVNIARHFGGNIRAPLVHTGQPAVSNYFVLPLNVGGFLLVTVFTRFMPPGLLGIS